MYCVKSVKYLSERHKLRNMGSLSSGVQIITYFCKLQTGNLKTKIVLLSNNNRNVIIFFIYCPCEMEIKLCTIKSLMYMGPESFGSKLKLRAGKL